RHPGLRGRLSARRAIHPPLRNRHRRLFHHSGPAPAAAAGSSAEPRPRDPHVTIKAFVIGHPIAHSRSPLIHGQWLAEHGIDGSYEAIDVTPDALPGFFERLRNGEFAGGNVTIPHKEAVFALCDSVDPLATTIGAVNTLVVR